MTKRIGLVQLNNSFPGASYFPYSVGLFQAYYQRYGRKPRETEFLEPIFERRPVAAAVEHLAGADLAAFSVYAWNLRLSLAMAEALKKRDPKCLIAFGGPQIPRDGRAFLGQNPQVDLICHGEGERTVTQVIDRLDSGDWGGLPAVSYRRGGQLVINESYERLEDLGSIPSPYLSGVFDPLLEKYRDRQWLALWETNRGCPFACAFCDWGAPEQRRMFHFPLERAKAELRWFSERGLEFIFCCDSNFGLFERDVELARYAAELRAENGFPKALSVQNGKNSARRIIQVQEALARGGLNKGVTLALQSADPQVLANIGRQNISSQAFAELQRHFSARGISTYTDLLLGLPGETYESFLKGVDLAIDGGQFNRIQFGNLCLLPNSRLAEPAYIDQFGLKTAASKCVNIHGQPNQDPGAVDEIQLLVVSTACLPEADWVRCRAWAWMCALLFFDKLLQIPFSLMRGLKNIPISRLVEKFMDSPPGTLPAGLADFFREGAETIQRGGPEYHYAEEFLGLYWPHDEYCLIRLFADERLDDFYREAQALLLADMNPTDGDDWRDIISQSVNLNLALMKGPLADGDVEIKCDYNIWEYFDSRRRLQPIELQRVPRSYLIRRQPAWADFEDWCRRVVWYENKKGGYWWPLEII